MEEKQQKNPMMEFCMPMMKDWVPERLRPWIYIVQVFCIQFTSGIYLGALDCIRGTTNFMIEDVLFLLYAGLAGMAIYFPMLFRMKFRFTNQQLLCGAAITIAVCNLITMHCTSMPVLMVVCFIAGMAKLQGTFENMSIIQLWFAPKREMEIFFPVLHIVLLTSIEGSGFVAAWFGHHFTWQMMHIFTVGTMCLVLFIQLVLCRPFCPMPHRVPLKGLDVYSGILISILMLMVSYIMVYGDYLMWMDNPNLRLLAGGSLILFALIILRLRNLQQPYINLRIFTYKNVLPILITCALAELLLGCEHTLEEILYSAVIELEELEKEEQFLWSLPGIYCGVLITLFWLWVKKWKVWRLFAFAFGCITVYAMLMYFTLDINVNIEQYRLAIVFRGIALAIMGATLMWSLHESIHDLTEFFMGLFIFNIFHMYLAGAAGYGIYTTLFSHFLSDNMSRYGSQLSLTHLDMAHFNFGQYIGGDFLHSMMMVSLKQVYGIVIWTALFTMLAFLLLDIPAVRTNVVKLQNLNVPTYGTKVLNRIVRRRHRKSKETVE